MSRIRTGIAVVLLTAAASLGAASPALAHCPEPGTIVLSDENYARFVLESPEEQHLITENSEYRAVWLECLPPSRVEPNLWGPGYVCIPEGAVQ